MARKRKVTSEVIESMKMLHDQGVKVAMIADVLSFSKWTVYQAKNADWNLDKYVETLTLMLKRKTLKIHRFCYLQAPL